MHSKFHEFSFAEHIFILRESINVDVHYISCANDFWIKPMNFIPFHPSIRVYILCNINRHIPECMQHIKNHAIN